jgi:5-epi-alpha-selinene synthase
VPSFFSLIEPLERILLSADVKARQDVTALGRLAGSIICWTNDLLSYDKERAHSDVHNLVMVYEHHRGLSVGAAAAQAVGCINEATRDFCERAAQLPPLGSPHDAEIRHYLQVLGSVIRITLAWTYESTRYAEVDQDSRARPLERTA